MVYDTQDLSGHLLYALCHGLVHAAQQVIEASKDTSLDLSSPLQCANYQGLTPLAIAALLPSTQCLELLLAKDVAVDGTDNHGKVSTWSVSVHEPSPCLSYCLCRMHCSTLGCAGR